MLKSSPPHRAGRVRAARATSSCTRWREDFGIRITILPAFPWLTSDAGSGDAHN